MQFQIGDIVEGKVTGITKFGAFVQLSDGTTGLVHISEISDEYVRDINQYLKEEQIVKVKVLSADHSGKVSLSIKKAQERAALATPAKANRSDSFFKEKNNSQSTTFEDKLAKFIKDSDERLLDLKKNVEAKRGSGAYKRTAHF